jgi:hypothetical protein
LSENTIKHSTITGQQTTATTPAKGKETAIWNIRVLISTVSLLTILTLTQCHIIITCTCGFNVGHEWEVYLLKSYGSKNRGSGLVYLQLETQSCIKLSITLKQ